MTKDELIELTARVLCREGWPRLDDEEFEERWHSLLHGDKHDLRATARAVLAVVVPAVVDACAKASCCYGCREGWPTVPMAQAAWAQHPAYVQELPAGATLHKTYTAETACSAAPIRAVAERLKP